MKKVINTEKGFTLIELLVVIAIIALLASIVSGSLRSSRQKAEYASRILQSEQIATAIRLGNFEQNSYPESANDFIYLDEQPGSLYDLNNPIKIDTLENISIIPENKASYDNNYYYYHKNNDPDFVQCGPSGEPNLPMVIFKIEGTIDKQSHTLGSVSGTFNNFYWSDSCFYKYDPSCHTASIGGDPCEFPDFECVSGGRSGYYGCSQI